MYSLPIATYTDYWRSAKNRSFTVGSTLLLAGSTLVYSPIDKILERPESNYPIAERIRIDTPVNPESLSKPENPDFLQGSITTESLTQSEPIIPSISGKVAVNYRVEDIEIPVTTEYVESNQIPPGMSKVGSEGKKGVERRVIRTTYVGGELTEEHTIHQFYRDAPKKRVVMQNTQPIKGEAMDITKLNVKKTFTVEATAYTYTGNPTATGVYPREGLIAVDPRVIPLGTQVYVEGYGYAVAADTGGAIKGNIIDVFFPSLQRCLDWGRRPVKIYLLS
jgi:3D (Asp-Asp-Asp) domain-containing protein